MRASLRALLTGVIDYAGLFPPAKLPLDAAFSNFLRYRASPESWMLGKFICPADQLSSLSSLPRSAWERTPTLCVASPELSFSILGRGGSDGATFFANLSEDLALIEKFRHSANSAKVDAFEVRLPTDIVTANENRQAEFIQRFAHAFSAPFVSFEAGFVGDWQKSLPALFTVLQADASGSRFGFKLRCGGLDAAAFPTVEQVAFVLHECRERDVPLKFTAGLHHPIRHFDAALATRVHGFINVFAAGVLAHARDLREQELCNILADDNPDHFRFDADTFHWQKYEVTLAEIAEARRRCVTSFGSCSFEEPIADLREMGLLESD